MEKSGEEERGVVLLDRASRATRGKRLTKLLDEEIHEDDLFWNQDALKEDDHDDNYQEEPEIADEFDSDFDEHESEPDDQDPPINDVDEKMHKKKRLIFPGKILAKKKKKKKILSKLENSPKEEENSPKVAEEQHDDTGERMVRKSTRTSVIVRQAERDAIRAALQATMKPVKRKKEGAEKRMTQEEMLLEAAQTEIMNLRNLERVLAREEEVKRRAIVHKTVYNGPQIRYISKDGCSYLEFAKGASFHFEIATTSVQYPEQPVCTITGLPAKYRDPKTGLPYATKEAFKIIRECFSNENANTRKDMSMGGLYDSVSGFGFSIKQKRSIMPDKNVNPDGRSLARFRRIPAFEDEDSD
ncbi:SWR1 complex subunit 2 [Abrus precatorius]|uniref:SWR1 complex subunit 2 n=1 Tax=Abrus precatorius TaxID=3816 RepID=A0A8B8KG00_ABRPR|nr:SWR1 complex subunit 2 [Abrus precatorius]XP_027342147.1 SWR1 complex subunit 2 [Abrus precatorius]XP_027342148.1 SWR1 complex subunit 2 [Abrus precatorius]